MTPMNTKDDLIHDLEWKRDMAKVLAFICGHLDSSARIMSKEVYKLESHFHKFNDRIEEVHNKSGLYPVDVPPHAHGGLRVNLADEERCSMTAMVAPPRRCTLPKGHEQPCRFEDPGEVKTP